MSSKTVFVRSVVNILNLKKCKRTTSRHGVKAEKQHPITVKCSVRIVTEEKVIFSNQRKKQMPPNPHRVHLLFLFQNGGDIRRRSFTDGDAFLIRFPKSLYVKRYFSSFSGAISASILSKRRLIFFWFSRTRSSFLCRSSMMSSLFKLIL